jgi:hypothetical protein
MPVAVDNFYRLVVMGPRGAVSDFRRTVAHTVSRPAIGDIDSWREFVPISIERIRSRYDLVRRATSAALDPFEVSAWPTCVLDKRRAALRYQFQTRNCEFIDFLKPLSRCFPSLTFVLVTLWLDDSEIASCLVRRGQTKRWKLSRKRREWHWNRARQRYGIQGDAVYDDDEAEFFAEQAMLAEALANWLPPSDQRRRWSWWNRPKVRDLDVERQLAVITLAEQMKSEKQKEAVKKPRRGGKRSEVRIERVDPGLLAVYLK